MILIVDLKGSVNSIETIPLKDNEGTLEHNAIILCLVDLMGDGVSLIVTT